MQNISESKKRLSTQAFENVERPEMVWLKPAEVATLTGLDEKWLSAAREGRKRLSGPPYKKIGSGKTSPVRYPLNELIEWMESFPLQGGNVLSFSSFSDFSNGSNASTQWPFVIYSDGTIDELFASINSSRFMNEHRTRNIVWLAKSSLPQAYQAPAVATTKTKPIFRRKSKSS